MSGIVKQAAEAMKKRADNVFRVSKRSASRPPTKFPRVSPARTTPMAEVQVKIDWPTCRAMTRPATSSTTMTQKLAMKAKVQGKDRDTSEGLGSEVMDRKINEAVREARENRQGGLWESRLVQLDYPVLLQVQRLREDQAPLRRSHGDFLWSRGKEVPVHGGRLDDLIERVGPKAGSVPLVVLEGDHGTLVASKKSIAQAQHQVMGHIVKMEDAVVEDRAVVLDRRGKGFPPRDVLKRLGLSLR